MITTLKFIRRYGKMVLICGWAAYITYVLVSGKVEASAAFEKLTGADVISILLGAW